MPTNKSFGLVVSDNIFKISASQKQEFPIGPVLKVLFEKSSDLPIDHQL
jgi:hypothetical protein